MEDAASTLDLAGEAEAFNERITVREQAGYIPDIRRAVKCDYFYKSFWRDPAYVELYLGRMTRTLLTMTRAHAGERRRVLDLGCGAGYFSLEFARAGHHVHGVDIADKAIDAARKTLADNPYKTGFGALSYAVAPLQDIRGTYDVVLVTGVLHHLPDLGDAAARIEGLLADGGVIVGYEPCHERWRREDAAQVALMRGMLSLTGHWFDPQEDARDCRTAAALERWIGDVHDEYVNERDKNEPGGQSPNDNAANGAEVLAALAQRFDIIEERPGAAFIYRLLGGMRGPDATLHAMARFLALYEEHMVASGMMQPNGFYFAARKRNLAGSGKREPAC